MKDWEDKSLSPAYREYLWQQEQLGKAIVRSFGCIALIVGGVICQAALILINL